MINMREDIETDKLLDLLNTQLTNWAMGQGNDKLFARTMTGTLLELQIELAKLGIAGDWLED